MKNVSYASQQHKNTMKIHETDRIGMLDTEFKTSCGLSKLRNKHTSDHKKVTAYRVLR